ncbi:hypothetical protein [Streptomyces johnsoniae]|uniref:DUF4190 domain-containing protein n=1 Tax=Streptomyces johnsoniae TaxID=3075532 RepID=A0ABU2RXW6_9ACTN|nr:hypothetical protein [Streptomyces sp. DSM 41886]MDT0441064.1 hypothetical protein [Streptomyces sp. DSM 41886]
MTADPQPVPFRPPAGAVPLPAQAPPFPRPYPPPPPRNGAGTAALVCGAVSAALCWTFTLSALALLPGLLAIVFGAVGLVRARRGTATNRGVALGGLWSGAGGLVVGAVLTWLFVAWLDEVVPVESAAGAEYLAAAGEEVVFGDGVTVTVAEPRLDPFSGAVSVAVRVTNEGRGTADLRGFDLAAAADGEPIDGGDVRYGADDLRDRLAPGEHTEVSYRVALPGPATYLGVDFSPGGDYEFGCWDLSLPGGAGAGADGPGGGIDV